MRMIDEGLSRRPVHPALWVAVALMALPELLFAAVDAGYLGRALSRGPLYEQFAYWDVLFEHAVHHGVVPAQLVWSLVSHAFMHGGWLHLLMNSAAFIALGHAISSRIGIWPTAAIFAATAAAGALLFSVITDFNGPLVGASGAVFGFLGVLTAWQERALRRLRRDRSEIWQRILGLVVVNLVLDILTGGMLAWEAHLGGFIAGWALAYAYPPRWPRAPV